MNRVVRLTHKTRGADYEETNKALILSAIMMLRLVQLNFTAYASEASGISSSTSVVSVGDIFNVDLLVPPAENADTAIIKVEFDSSAFEVVNWNPTIPGAVINPNGDGFFSLQAANATRAIDLSSGLKLSAELKVKDSAAMGDYTIRLTESSFSYFDEETFEDVELWFPTTTSVDIKVQDHVLATEITLNKNNLSLYTGFTEKLIATVIPENTDIVTWSSSDPSVASVSDDGTVSAIKEGTAKITATASNVSAYCDVTVKDPYIVTIPDNVNVTRDGEVLANGDAVFTGDSLVISAVALEGYELISLKVNDTEIENGGSYIVGEEDVTISVEYKEITPKPTPVTVSIPEYVIVQLCINSGEQLVLAVSKKMMYNI